MNWKGKKMLTRRILTMLTITLLIVLSEQVMSQTSQKELPEYPSDSESVPHININQNTNQAQKEFERFQMNMQRNISSMNSMQRVNPQERIREMQKMAQEQEDLAMRQTLRVDNSQWKIIKPKIEKVKYYKEQASVNIGMPFNSTFSSTSGPLGGQSFGGGFQVGFTNGGGGSSMPNFNQTNKSLTKGERICRELQALLDFQSVPGQTQISQVAIQAKIRKLQQARLEAKKKLEKAQEELKKGLNLQLQARLILLGLLD